MHEIRRSALVPYTAAQMFALVEDFESYEQFVPYVVGSRLLERGESEVVGKLEMERSGVREAFTTRTSFHPPREIRLVLIEGPFRTFDGLWSFDPIADKGCRVGLLVRFELKAPLLGMLLARTIERTCGELVDAFVTRARSIYGATHLSGPVQGTPGP